MPASGGRGPFEQVTIRAADRAASERFYRIVLEATGVLPTETGPHLARWDDFSLAQADAEHPPTRALHIGFAAPSRERVDAFWRAGVEAGYEDDGEPGERPQYTAGYYGGFLRDPAGLSAEAVHHEGVRRDGRIDHLWIGVRDLDAAAAFYDSLAPEAGLRRGGATGDRRQFRGEQGSFSLVADGRPPTEGLHMAFAGRGPARVLTDPAGTVVELVGRAGG